MRGFTAFLHKELREILRTWRIWVLPGIVLFFAISGPPLAKITPELLGSLMTDQQPGVVIQLPDPTYVDAYLQWTKNLSQMVLFAVIIMFGGVISAEKKSGTAALVLTKPLSRSAFVLAKFVSQAALVAVPIAAGALATWGITYATFGEAPLAPLAEATGAWLVFALMFVALMELLSAALDSQAGAAGIGFGAYILLSVAGLWAPMLDYSPAGLVGAPTTIVMDKTAALGWPIAVTLALTALFVAGAVLVFKRREL
jgi:ABC-2 type transport system permease protein